MELNQQTLPAYLDVLERERGVTFSGYKPKYVVKGRGVGDSIANLPAADMATIASGGIPAVASQVIYPVLIQQLFAPLNATEFYSERQAATGWSREDELFPHTEEAYEVTGYSDVSRAGSTHVNPNYELRRQARFQIMTTWGDLEQSRYAEGRIPYVAMKQQKAIQGIRRFFNAAYMYGISGMPNYGLLNDPSLLPAIAPVPTSDGKTEWADKDAIGVYNDFVRMFTALTANNRGLVDVKSKMKLGVGPSANAALTKINALGTDTAESLIKKTFTGVEIVVIPEFDTETGGLVQLKADDLDGTPTGECVFSQK